MILRVETHRQVIRLSAVITCLSVAAPVAVVGGILSLAPNLPVEIMIGSLLMASLIPLFIAPPIAYVGLSMLWMLTKTVDKVDAQVKYDSLTGVLNRSHFLDSVRGRRADGMLLIVDADNFKSINDSRGHAAGDEALRVLGHTLERAAGPKAFVGRLGGEEFGVFLPGSSLQDGTSTAVALCHAVAGVNMIVDGRPLSMTISIGGTLHQSSTIIGHSLKVADDRLYKAKQTGKNRAVLDGPTNNDYRQLTA